jgi:hypothetical protein
MAGTSPAMAGNFGARFTESGWIATISKPRFGPAFKLGSELRGYGVSHDRPAIYDL